MTPRFRLETVLSSFSETGIERTSRGEGRDMKKSKLVVSLSCLVVLLTVTSLKGSDDWVEFSRTNQGDIGSYDKASIKQVTKDIVQVWVKDVFSAERRKKLIEYHKYITNIDQLTHDVSLNEIDCTKKMYRSLSITGRSADGNDLFSSSDDNSRWNRISNNSVWNTLQKAVCNQ